MSSVGEKRSILGWVLVLLIVTAGLGVWRSTSPGPGVDFYQFWVVGQALREGSPGNLYEEDFRTQLGETYQRRALYRSGSTRQQAAALQPRVLETVATPWLFSTFSMLTSRDYDRDLALYRAGALIVYMLSIGLMAHGLGYSPPATATVTALGLVWFEPLLSDLRVANVNAWQLGTLALYLVLAHRPRFRGRDLLAGFVLGLGVAFKPNLAVAAFLAIWTHAVDRLGGRLIREMAGGAAALMVAGIVSVLLVSRAAIWFDWLRALRSLPGEFISVRMGNFAFSRLPE